MTNTYSVITAIFADGHSEHTVAPNNNVECFMQNDILGDIIWGGHVERFEHCPITEFEFSSVSDDEANWIKEHYYQIKAYNDAEQLSVAR